MYIFGGRCDNGQWPGAGQSTEYYPDSVSYLVSSTDARDLLILVYKYFNSYTLINFPCAYKYLFPFVGHKTKPMGNS